MGGDVCLFLSLCVLKRWLLEWGENHKQRIYYVIFLGARGARRVHQVGGVVVVE